MSIDRFAVGLEDIESARRGSNRRHRPLRRMLPHSVDITVIDGNDEHVYQSGPVFEAHACLVAGLAEQASPSSPTR